MPETQPSDRIASSPPQITTPPWQARRRVWIVGLLILATLAASGGWWYYWSRFVWTDDARIEADIATVSAKVPGRIAELQVEEGSSVHAGDLIARLDDAEIREVVGQMRHDLEVQQKQVILAGMELEKARTRWEDLKAGPRKEEIAKAEAGLREADAHLTQSEQNWHRIEQLFNDGMVTVANRDQAFLSFRVAQESLQKAREQLGLLQTGERPLVIKEAEIEAGRAKAEVEVAADPSRAGWDDRPQDGPGRGCRPTRTADLQSRGGTVVQGGGEY